MSYKPVQIKTPYNVHVHMEIKIKKIQKIQKKIVMELNNNYKT